MKSVEDAVRRSCGKIQFLKWWSQWEMKLVEAVVNGGYNQWQF